MADDALATRLLGIFVEELGEQVQQLNDDLLALERAPGDVKPLSGVFRVMHTLKGAARAAGVLQVESLCHLLETDLARARDSGAPLGGAAIALLFEAADALGDARDRLAAGQSLVDGPIDVVMQHARGRLEPSQNAGTSAPRVATASPQPSSRVATMPAAVPTPVAAMPVVPPVPAPPA
ncbi:MAG: cheA, partial [Gemmatimonadetes bacterium]|nr:cheA [Gemmatimonadota bacterium]